MKNDSKWWSVRVDSLAVLSSAAWDRYCDEADGVALPEHICSEGVTGEHEYWSVRARSEREAVSLANRCRVATHYGLTAQAY